MFGLERARGRGKYPGETIVKIKSSELTGDALDWAVTRCKGWTVSVEEFLASQISSSKFSYSAVWAKGGPIIEAKEIDVVRDPLRNQWLAGMESRDATANGSTPLIAAMRCFVRAEMGDEVDIPEELLL